MQKITTDQAPAAIGPYSQAIEDSDWLFLSGQIPLDPETGRLVEGDIEDQTRRVIQNIQAVLEAAGASLESVRKATVFVTDLADFGRINHVYQTFFGSVAPARSTVQVAALPLGASIEIEVIARRPSVR